MGLFWILVADSLTSVLDKVPPWLVEPLPDTWMLTSTSASQESMITWAKQWSTVTLTRVILVHGPWSRKKLKLVAQSGQRKLVLHCMMTWLNKSTTAFRALWNRHFIAHETWASWSSVVVKLWRIVDCSSPKNAMQSTQSTLKTNA